MASGLSEIVLVLHAQRYDIDGKAGLTIRYIVPGDVVEEDEERGATVVEESKTDQLLWARMKDGSVPGFYAAKLVSDYKKLGNGRRAKVFTIHDLEFLKAVDLEKEASELESMK